MKAAGKLKKWQVDNITIFTELFSIPYNTYYNCHSQKNVLPFEKA